MDIYSCSKSRLTDSRCPKKVPRYLYSVYYDLSVSVHQVSGIGHWVAGSSAFYGMEIRFLHCGSIVVPGSMVLVMNVHFMSVKL